MNCARNVGRRGESGAPDINPVPEAQQPGNARSVDEADRALLPYIRETALENINNAIQALEGIKPFDQSPRDVESYLLNVEARLMAAKMRMEGKKNPPMRG